MDKEYATNILEEIATEFKLSWILKQLAAGTYRAADSCDGDARSKLSRAALRLDIVSESIRRELEKGNGIRNMEETVNP